MGTVRGNKCLGFCDLHRLFHQAFLNLVFAVTVVLALGCAREPVTPNQVLGPQDDETQAHRHGELAKDRARFKTSPADGAAGVDVLRYDVKGEFDWDTQRLHAIAAVTFRLLDTKLNELELESRAERIHSVTLKDKKPVAFQHENGKLKISLNNFSDEDRGAPLTVNVSYDATANAVGEGDPSSFTSVPVRESDPVKARVAFTTSEPVGASDWLPCHNVPYDRAFFSMEFTMEPEERLISNGDLVEDRVTATKRVMRYQTKYTLPTYLMAFAVGDFDYVTEREGNLPVSIWHRKGLPGAYREVLGQIRKMIRHYEGLMGSYPFEKYALVLLPEFPSGGLENASITFQAENRSSESRLISDFGLSAHELGHQWFGDYVTIDSWDDLWIKEGMATLLSEEATREFEDKNNAGRLFAQNFWTSEGDAIRDLSLKPDDKYTSGPYDRAGWLLTQIRSAAGEEGFWKAIRTVLKKNAFGSIGTEEFLTYFGPYLNRSTYQKLLTAVSAKRLPHIELTRAPDGTKAYLLTDPDGALIIPVTLRWYEDNGNFTEWEWEPGKRFAIVKDERRLLVMEPKDAQAINAFVVQKVFFESEFVPYMIPRNERQLKILSRLSGGVQSLALQWKVKWPVTAAQGKALYDSLSSEVAKFFAVQRFCDTAANGATSDAQTNWESFIRSALHEPVWLGIPRWSSSQGLGNCLKVVPDLFASPWETLAKAKEVPRPSQLHLYTFFPQEPKQSLAMWKNVLTHNDSVRTQLIALTGVARHGFAGTSFEAEPALKTEIRDYLLGVLRTSDGAEVQNALLGLSILFDKGTVKDIAMLIPRAHRVSVQTRAICVAYNALDKNVERWEEFLSMVGPTHSFAPKIQAALKGPSSLCP